MFWEELDRRSGNLRRTVPPPAPHSWKRQPVQNKKAERNPVTKVRVRRGGGNSATEEVLTPKAQGPGPMASRIAGSSVDWGQNKKKS